MQDVEGQGRSVISLSRRLRDSRFPVQGRLEAYWRGLRGTRRLPARADVDPRAIEDCLEYAFVLERIAPGLARFRLAGMHLNDLMGMEVRGMPLTCFFPPDDRRTISAALERVFSEPAMARIALRGEGGLGRPAMEAELSLLPLTSDFGDVTRVLGALTSVGPIGRTPRRFHVTEVTLAALTETPAPAGTAAPRPLLPCPEAATPPQPAFAEAPAPYAPPPAEPARPPRKGKPYLYVIHSNDD
jgi:hypothetical protein